MTDAQFENAVSRVLNTAALCGNECEALKDFCAEEGIKFTHDIHIKVMNEVSQRWHESQNAAGVKPKHWYH